MIPEYIKKARIEAVTGLKGSRHYIAFLLCAYQAAAACLRDSLTSALVAHSNYFRSLLSAKPDEKGMKQKRNVAFAIDFFTTTFPNILICVFADYIVEIFLGTIAICLCLLWLSQRKVTILELWNNPIPAYEVVTYDGKTSKISLRFFRQTNTYLLVGNFSLAC